MAEEDEHEKMGGISTAVVTARAAARLKAGHVWVYRSDVMETPDSSGSLLQVVDPRGAALGTALYSAHSEIPLRLVSAEPLESEDAWLRLLERRLRESLERRRELEQDGTDAGRLVSSEADRLPGLVIDRYGDLAIVEILNKALDRAEVRDLAVAALRSELDPSVIVERTDPKIREIEQIPLPAHPLLYAKEAAAPEAQLKVIFHLNGLAFHYDAGAGQKTGAFLDQRQNYQAAAQHAHGSALDVFTYQGGFALHLARVCDRVTGVDRSRAALEVAEENLEVNRGRLRAEVDWVEANAFDYLRDEAAAGRIYDTIVLDPPAFAHAKRAVPGALRGYRELHLRAFQMLAPGGTLVTCCCSHHVSADEFQSAVRAGAGDAGRRVRLVERRGAAQDHPVILNIPETEYLKCLILQVE